MGKVPGVMCTSLILLCLQRALGGATARQDRQQARAVYVAFAQQWRRAGLHTQRNEFAVHA